jgi:glycosyltransferase involved in cell wall biosynthesis
MKVGLYVLDFPPTLGGGYVMREDVAHAATEFRGRHQFELVHDKSLVVGAANVPWRERLLALGRRRDPRAARIARMRTVEAEVRRRGIQMLWFNHVEPIAVDIPYILNIFDLQHRLQPWFPEVSANGLWEHREEAWADALRRASVVTVGSQEAKEQLSLYYGVPLENIRVVPFPTPRAALDLAARETGARDPRAGDAIKAKYGIASDFLFYPAQFWPHKNHVNLLHALKILHERHGLRLSLVFTGSDHGNLAHVRGVAEKLGLSAFVHYLGFVPHEDVIALYHGAFALSYVSFFGPENLPPLEAMALGCPVVLSDIPGVRTLFGDGPVFVDPRSDVAIADAIRMLHDEPARRGERARIGREIATRNTPERYVQTIHAIVDDFEAMRRCWP